MKNRLNIDAGERLDWRGSLRNPQLLAAIACGLTLAVFVQGCNIGGAGAFVEGDSPEENNATYNGQPVTGDWVVMNLLDEPETLNPFTSTSASATNIYSYIYDSFLDRMHEPPWELKPHLVTKMPDISDDHLRYRWNLHRNVYWHDGEPMTMQDADFTLKAIMNPYVDDLPSKPYYRELDSLDIPDDYTLVMYCSKPYFMHVDFLGGFRVLPKHVFDPDGLIDDIRYYHVKNGSVFGKIADLLETEVDVSWDDLTYAVALNALKKAVHSQSKGKLDWDEIVEGLEGFDLQPADIRFERVDAFLENHPAGEASGSYIHEIQRSTALTLATLPISMEIELRTTPGGFPLRDDLALLCRDYHDRIEEFGNRFNTHEQNRAPTVGSGAYQFESWSTGQEIVIRRYEDYWEGSGHAYLDKIVWRILTDYTASLVALKNGEIDMMENLQTIQYLTMTNRPKFLDEFVKATYVIPSYTYLGWRNSHPIFKDKHVRRAMTHAVRRKDARDKLLFGFAELVTGNFYRYGQDYDSTIVPYEYNPEKAQRLLADAGWRDVDNDGILEKDTLEFKFEMLIPSGSAFAEQLVSVLREDLFMIGVEMSIRRLEWSVFINNYIRNHEFDACYLGWVFGMKGDPKQVWHSQSAEGRGSNHIEFRNARADSIIDAARVEFDREKRIALYYEFQQILHEEQPYTFLFSTMRKPAYDKRFKGVKLYPFRPGYQFEEWFVPKEEQKYVEG